MNVSDSGLQGGCTLIGPLVNPETKMGAIQASVPKTAGGLVAGLFGEGRLAAQKRLGVLVPEQAVDQTGGVVPSVMRLKGGKVEKVDVQLGLRDEEAERVEITSGLAAGDTVLLGAARGISVGVAVTVSAPTDAAAKNPTAKAVAPTADSTPKAKN